MAPLFRRKSCMEKLENELASLRARAETLCTLASPTRGEAHRRRRI
jgi:hypothetical protein